MKTPHQTSLMPLRALLGVCLIAITATLAACGGGSLGSVACGSLLGSACGNDKPNTAPIANAGTLQNVTLDVPAQVNGAAVLIKMVTLDGSRSSDEETESLNLKYRWTLAERPSGSVAALSDTAAVRPTFIADTVGTYRATLVVSDGKLESAPVSLTVVASITNSAPVANPGVRQEAVLGSIVMLDGTASTDSDLSDPRTYRWTLQVPVGSASSARLSDATSPRPIFTADKVGEYVATLVVGDGKVLSQAASSVVVVSVENTAPTALAGDDQNVTLKTSPLVTTVSLDGTNSSDAQNDRLTYKWAWMSYPGTSAPTLASTSPRPTFNPSAAGTYVLTLTVNDGKKDSAPDPITVTVTAANSSPVAVAGTDQYVPVSSANKVTLSSAGSYDPDGDAIAYRWYLSRPMADTTAELSSSVAASPTFTAAYEGVYVASLVITDVNGNASTVSQTRVTASSANSPPVANAGPKQSISGNTLVSLDGTSSSDGDGDTLTYAWSIQSKPELSSSTLALTDPTTATPSFTPDVVGVYVIKLVVSDGKVSSAAHTVTIVRTD